MQQAGRRAKDVSARLPGRRGGLPSSARLRRACGTAVEALEGRRLLAATAVAAGPEFLVNQFVEHDQKHQSLAADADGDFVVVWASEYQHPDGTAVYARRYDRE